ncbi:Ig-like domain-containing protein [Kitasatospora sp. NPDC089913]|uniref:Ig-like domain-containing protein n=1 Tax=Kitasatospora sp. NPDC089913 TaxID=3364080 RepID=UPI00382373C5
MTLTGVSAPGHGTAALIDGKGRYSADAGLPGFDTFTYTVRDRLGRTATGTVNVAVAARGASG